MKTIIRQVPCPDWPDYIGVVYLDKDNRERLKYIYKGVKSNGKETDQKTRGVPGQEGSAGKQGGQSGRLVQVCPEVCLFEKERRPGCGLSRDHIKTV
jgi:hypothetical protein